MDTAFRILKDIDSTGLEPQLIFVGGNDDRVHQIMKDVDASLEPYRKTKFDALTLANQALDRKVKSAANVSKAKVDAAKAHEKLDEHNTKAQARKAEKVRARVEQLASGAKLEPHILNFDIDRAAREIQKRAEDAAEEADAVLAQLQEIDTECGNALLTTEFDVSAAEAAIYQANLDGIATAMLEHESIIRGLHSKLYALAPNGIFSNGAKKTELVKQALALVEVDQIEVAKSITAKLRQTGAIPTLSSFTPSEPVVREPQPQIVGYRVPGPGLDAKVISMVPENLKLEK